MNIFNSATVGSIIIYAITCWYGNTRAVESESRSRSRRKFGYLESESANNAPTPTPTKFRLEKDRASFILNNRSIGLQTLVIWESKVSVSPCKSLSLLKFLSLLSY